MIEYTLYVRQTLSTIQLRLAKDAPNSIPKNAAKIGKIRATSMDAARARIMNAIQLQTKEEGGE